VAQLTPRRRRQRDATHEAQAAPETHAAQETDARNALITLGIAQVSSEASLPPARIRPRPRWDQIRSVEQRWGDLDKHQRDQLDRWMRGEY